jgi:hypothetical protein
MNDEEKKARKKAYHKAYAQQPEVKARREKAYGRPKSSLHYRGEH